MVVNNSVSTGHRALKHQDGDAVAIAVTDIAAQDVVEVGCPGDGRAMKITASTAIPFGHKLALTAVHKGDAVLEYGTVIGTATRRIGVGDHVHTVGNAVIPVIKTSANPITVNTMSEHIDLDVSAVIDLTESLDEATDRLFDLVVATASGRRTAAEVLRHDEFVLTRLFRSA